MHLISYAGPGGRHLQCTLIYRAGKKMKIRSHHSVGLANFEDRTKCYGTFIRELVARLGTHGHDVGFHHGSRSMRVVWMTLFWLSILVLVGFLFAMIGGTDLSWSTILTISVLTICVPISWSMSGQNWAGTFDP